MTEMVRSSNTSHAKGGLSTIAAGATQKLAAFAAKLEFGAIPREVVEHVKLLALDGIGCCLYGSGLPWTRKLAAMLKEEGGATKAAVIGARFRTSPSQAALANSTAAHAFESDDVHTAAMFHPTSICLPVALACAQAEGGKSGRDVITAMVAGYEVGARVGMAGTMGLFFRGWHPQGTSGTFVSAAAAARMLGLSPDQAWDAVGIAASQASGLMAAQEGSMVKRMHSGRAAQSGVYGALLARKGFTGIRNVLEADYGGYLSTLSENVDATALLKGLGSDWETSNVGFKLFSSVASIHTSLDALRGLMREHGLGAQDIEELRADVGTMTHVHCCWKYEAQGITAAQMNLFYGLAVMALEGEAFVDQYTEDRLCDGRLMEFIKRIKSDPDPEIDRMGPAFRHAARVSILTRDGRRFNRELLHRIGSPANPVTKETIYAKFRTLARNCLDDAQIERVIDFSQNLEHQEDLQWLFETLQGSSETWDRTRSEETVQ